VHHDVQELFFTKYKTEYGTVKNYAIHENIL